MRYRTTNPVMRHMQKEASIATSNTATYAGVVSKTSLMLLIMLVVGTFTAGALIQQGEVFGGMPLLIGAPIVAIICVFIAMSKPDLAPLFSIIYALMQGAFLGVISGIYTLVFGDHIVTTALLATGGVFAAMLFLYRSGIIRVGSTFRKIMMSILFGLLLANLFLFVASIFGADIYGNMFGFYVLVVVIGVVAASIFLLLDFDNITQLVEAGADKKYEWSLGLSLVVTIVWLFVEMLRLLAIIAMSRR